MYQFEKIYLTSVSVCGILFCTVDQFWEFFSAHWISLWNFILLIESVCGILFCTLNQFAEFYSAHWSVCGILFCTLNQFAEYYSARWISFWNIILHIESVCGILFCTLNQLAEYYSAHWISLRDFIMYIETLNQLVEFYSTHGISLQRFYPAHWIIFHCSLNQYVDHALWYCMQNLSMQSNWVREKMKKILNNEPFLSV